MKAAKVDGMTKKRTTESSGRLLPPRGKAFEMLVRTSILIALSGLVGLAAMKPNAAQAAEREAEEPLQSQDEGFWARDVWVDPNRPFLFYGNEAKPKEARSPGPESGSPSDESKREATADEPESLAIFPADGQDRAQNGTALTKEAEAAGLETLKGITSVKGLREEVEKRLDAAVMNPTPEAIGLYLQANAFLIQKAGVFAESWKRSLVNNPRFDWTAVRPAVNVVSSAISHEREGRMLREVKRMGRDYGFVFFGDDSVLTRHMLAQVREFAQENAFEVAYVASPGAEAMLPNARSDMGLSRVIAGGVTQFPALVLVKRDEKDPARARLVATGAADAMTIARNTVAAALEMSAR